MNLMIYEWWSCLEVRTYNTYHAYQDRFEISCRVINFKNFYDQLHQLGAKLIPAENSMGYYSRYELSSNCKVEVLNWLTSLHIMSQVAGDN
jgi:hypothetical protein